MIPKYNIGDKVWYAHFESITRSAICPECMGDRYLTVIMGDDSRVTIPCAGCSSGYDQPTGYVSYWESAPMVHQTTIDGMEVSKEKVKYKIETSSYSWRILHPEDVFDTSDEAAIRAKEMSDEYNKKQLDKLNKKDFQHRHRTWAWHVHYYRREIREAKKTIEFAEKKLSAAKEKAKEK